MFFVLCLFYFGGGARNILIHQAKGVVVTILKTRYKFCFSHFNTSFRVRADDSNHNPKNFSRVSVLNCLCEREISQLVKEDDSRPCQRYLSHGHVCLKLSTCHCAKY